MFLQPNCLNACDFRARKDRLVDLLSGPSEPGRGWGGGKGAKGQPQIREQMSGPDLQLFTLKFLALTISGFFMFSGSKNSKKFVIKMLLCNFSVGKL